MMKASRQPLVYFLDVVLGDLLLAPCSTPAARVVTGLPKVPGLLDALFLGNMPTQAVCGILADGPSTPILCSSCMESPGSPCGCSLLLRGFGNGIPFGVALRISRALLLVGRTINCHHQEACILELLCDGFLTGELGEVMLLTEQPIDCQSSPSPATLTLRARRLGTGRTRLGGRPGYSGSLSGIG